MHNGTLLGEATLDVQSKTFTVSFNWAISEDRQQDIKNLLADFFCKGVQVIEGNEVDRISMVTPHLYSFWVQSVTPSLVHVRIEVAEEFTEEQEKELLQVMEKRKS